MSRVRNTNTVVCDGCGVEITWAPWVVHKRMYCCRDCAEGRPCQCDYPPEEPQQASRVPAEVVQW
jgi:hypothetical protein